MGFRDLLARIRPSTPPNWRRRQRSRGPSEPGEVVPTPEPHLPTPNGPSVFEGANAHISGGVFTTIAGHNNVVHNTVHVARGTEEPQDTVEDILAMLQTCVGVDPWAFHDNVQANKTPDTGVTFISRSDIRTWIDTVRGVFWLKGGPGTGKTYLVSTLFDQLYKAFRASKDSESAAGIAYLQFNAQMSEREIVMVLIMHLVKCNPLPSVLDYIRSAFADFPRPGRAERPTSDQLCKILGDIVKKYRRCYIFIDGLDEMKEWVREMLIRILASLEANILIASRDLTALEEMFAKLRRQTPVTVEITAEEKDLDLYINQVIDQSDRLSRILSRAPHRQVKLVTIVKSKSKGMFLHVKLQMEALQHCLDIRELFKVVEEIPEGIRGLYSDALERIKRQPGSQGERAKQTLVWVLNAKRPLSLEELQHAMAAIPPDYKINPDSLPSKEDLLMICCGLLSVDNFNNVGFLHLTAQEILPDLLSLTFPAPQASLALTCISILEKVREAPHLLTLQDLEEEFAKVPLLQYAYDWAPHHLQQAMEERPELESPITTFIQSCQSFPYHHPLSIDFQHLGPLHVACKFGLPSIVEALLRHDPKGCNRRAVTSSGQGWSGLMIAGGAGHTEVVQTIFEFFAARTSDVDASGRNALLAAAVEGHDRALVDSLFGGELPKALSSNQNDTDSIPGKGGPEMPTTPTSATVLQLGSVELGRALERGDIETAKLLLATPGVDTNLRDKNGNSPLMLASAKGYTEVVDLLLAVPLTDTNLCNRTDGNSALMQASSQGHTDIVKLLLAAPRIEINLCNRSGDSAIMQASYQGYAEIVKLLLAVPGVDVNLCNESGNSAIMQASYQGYAEVVKLFLATPGVELNLCDKDANSALMWASHWGHTGVIKLLLAAPGVAINLCDKNGDSALMQVSYIGSTEVVRLLLAAPGVDVDIRNFEGKSALDMALEPSHWYDKKGVVELLQAALSERSR